MQNKPIFEYLDYKLFLKELSDKKPRGFKGQLANAMRCQTAYLSQVLNSNYQLSLEQAYSAAMFLQFQLDEIRYFVLLVELQRAGTSDLKKHFEDQLFELQKKYQLIEERVAVNETLTDQHQGIYYSSWHFSAVHMAVTIPKLQTKKELARALRINSKKLDSVLSFLCSVGLLIKDGDKLLPGTTKLHLPKDSQFIFQHHVNWRLCAIGHLYSEKSEDNLNYSSVSSLSNEDFILIKKMFLQIIGEVVSKIKDSNEESLAGINIDFFKIT